MRIPRVVVLLAAVAALGAWVYLRELPEAEREGKKDKLLAVDRSNLTGITLTYPDRAIELRKGDAGWRLTKPGNAPADENAVTALLTALVDAEVQRTLDDVPQDLSQYGLDKPSVTATLTLKDGSQTPPVAVGKNTAFGGKTYVRKGDEPKLYLTNATLGVRLNKQPKDLRDKVLVSFQDDEVTRVEIARDDGTTTTLARKDKDAWTVEPGGHPADATEVRSYLSSLKAARATDFPNDDPTDLAPYGLDHPRLAVTVTSGKDGAEAKRSILLGGEGTEGTQRIIYAKRGDQPTIYAVGDWSLRTLGKTSAQLRDKTLLGFDPVHVGKVTLARKDGPPLTLERADKGWKLEGAAEGETVNTETVARFLDDLRELRGSDIAAEPAGDLAAFGLAAPDLRVGLTDKEGQAIGVVLASKHAAKHYATREGSDAVLEVQDYMYTRLDRQRADFLKGAEPAPPAAGDGSPADEEDEAEPEGELDEP